MTEHLADRTNLGPDHRHPDDDPLPGVAPEGACSDCGHLRPLDAAGAVEPHTVIVLDYVAAQAGRQPCPGSGEPPPAVVDVDALAPGLL